MGLKFGSVLHEKYLSLNIRLTLSTMRGSHSARKASGNSRFAFPAYLHSEGHTLSRAYAHGVKEQWDSLPVVNSPFHPLRRLFHWSPNSPVPPLYFPLHLATPAFSLSLFCRKHQIECAYKYYVTHFHCVSRRYALSGQYYYAAHRTTDIFSARRELEITLWSGFQIIF